MPYKTNDFQSDLSISELFANFMDKAFYRPMEKLIQAPAEATPTSFERVWAKGPQMRGIDVILHEGPWQTTIDEKAPGDLRPGAVLSQGRRRPCRMAD